MPLPNGNTNNVGISIIVPTFNEGFNIREVLTDVITNLNHLNKDWEIIVVDDSTDSTYDILAEIASMEPNVNVIHRHTERGFGSAIRTGLMRSKGNVVMVIMGDGSDDPKFINEFLDKIDEGYDIVIGSRFMKNSRVTDYPFAKCLANRSFNILAKLIFNLKTNDLSTSFKAYRRCVIESIQTSSDGFEISPEITLKAIRHGFKYSQIPVTWTGRKFGQAKFRVTASALSYFRLVMRLFLDRCLKAR